MAIDRQLKIDAEIELLQGWLNDAMRRCDDPDEEASEHFNRIRERLNELIMEKRDIMFGKGHGFIGAGEMVVRHPSKRGVFLPWATWAKKKKAKIMERKREGYTKEEIEEMEEWPKMIYGTFEKEPLTPVVSHVKTKEGIETILHFPSLNVQWMKHPHPVIRDSGHLLRQADITLRGPFGDVMIYSHSKLEYMMREGRVLYRIDRGGDWFSEPMPLMLSRHGVQDAIFQDAARIAEATGSNVNGAILAPEIVAELGSAARSSALWLEAPWITGQEVYLADDQGVRGKIENIEPPDTRTPFQKELDHIK